MFDLPQDPTTDSNLSIDPEGTMNSLVFNYFGFLGLVAFNSKASYLRTYQQQNKPITNIKNISNDNTITVLSLRDAYLAKMLKPQTAIQMGKVLQAIRQKKINSANFDEEQVRALLDDIKYTKFRPSARIFSLLKNYHSGDFNLLNFTKDLYILSKFNDFAAYTIDFRDIVVRGQYLKQFSNVDNFVKPINKTVKAKPIINSKKPKRAGTNK